MVELAEDISDHADDRDEAPVAEEQINDESDEDERNHRARTRSAVIARSR